MSETIEKGVLVPVPVVVMSAVEPAVPADWSQARKVMDSLIAPCQLAVGWKKRRSVGCRSRAADSLGMAVILIQVVPLLSK